jgi:hypothetical protein
MHAKILSYSRSRGLFAGLSLEGATLRPDAEANENLYGQKVSHDQILKAEVPAPSAARPLLNALTQYSSAEPATPVSEAVETEDTAAQELANLRRVHGVLTITSKPSIAEVELNGYFNGMTPRSKEVQPGEYKVTLRKPGFAEWEKTVAVGPGERVTVEADLSAAR